MAKADILIVDDEELLAASMARRLLQAGYACSVATSLAAARAQVIVALPALLILDERLPDGSGLDFLEELESQGRLADCDVIMLTAFGEINDAVEAIKLGAADYLTKPIDLNFLVIAVEHAMEERRLREQLHQGACSPGKLPTLAESEQQLLEAALEACGGNVSEAARRLGISRMTMRYRMAKYSLDK